MGQYWIGSRPWYVDMFDESNSFVVMMGAVNGVGNCPCPHGSAMNYFG